MVKFECLRCSHCCSNLLIESNGILRGLALTPEETNLFPVDHVFPSVGIGIYGQPKKVVTFQLDLSRCPHLEGSLCRIYDKRPIACRIYPFETPNQNLDTYIDRKCKWYRDKVVSTGERKNLMAKHEKVGIPEEVTQSLVKHFEIYGKILKNDCWIFDLNKKAWFKPIEKMNR